MEEEEERGRKGIVLMIACCFALVGWLTSLLFCCHGVKSVQVQYFCCEISCGNTSLASLKLPLLPSTAVITTSLGGTNAE